MKVVFRVDASLETGTGHVMRCLTLADALRTRGVTSCFVTRAHRGNLIPLLHQKGYDVAPLPGADTEQPKFPGTKEPVACGLTVPWEEDASQTLKAMQDFGTVNWVVVDHYGIDARWELAVRSGCGKLLVIDDLANRPHCADLLLDQTLGRQHADYEGLVNPECQLRCGVEYALLRPEFDAWRAHSLKRRSLPNLQRILVSLGGADNDNISRDILLALELCELPSAAEVCVVLGKISPWVAELRQLAERLRTRVEVKVGVSNMAELLAHCDLAIGAAGTSAWERCCLGVPTLVLVLADNQREIASKLSSTGAALRLPSTPHLEAELAAAVRRFTSDPGALLRMSEKAAGLVPCSGAGRLAEEMTGGPE
jgi:UDP-2,4-diacetamido-2,4,6-trideoxy-beta-L-altropyranose hydrolase